MSKLTLQEATENVKKSLIALNDQKLLTIFADIEKSVEALSNTEKKK